MKKITIILLLLILFPLSVNAAGLAYVKNSDTLVTEDGLIARNIKATLTNDNGGNSTQNITVLKNDGSLLTTVWSYVNSSGAIVNRDVLSIAKDFEEKKPGYEVMAAVNGDYFSSNQTINANVIYRSKLLNAVNHSKYFSIEITPQGGLDETHKSLSVNDLYAYFYDNESNALQYVTPLLSVNQRTSKENETAIFYNYSSINNKVTSHYQFDIVTKYINGLNYAFSLDNVVKKESIIETTTTKIALETTNPIVTDLLSNGSVVKVQQRIKNFDEGNTMIGVGSNILLDGNVRTFAEIVDQSIDFSSARHPRTGIGFDANNQPILFTVDGRQASSAGVNLREFALIMKENGAINGFNLDGGGSTQAVIKRNGVLEIFNQALRENNGLYRTVSNAVLFIKPKSIDVITETKTDDSLSLLLPSLNYDVFVNNVKENLTSTTFNMSIDKTVTTAVSVINKTTNEAVYTKLFYKTMDKLPIDPTFTVDALEVDGKLTINVSFEDPDQLLDRMYIIHDETEERQVALVKYMGLRSATFKVINEGNNPFTIYYELKTGKKDTITYNYNKELIEEPVVIEDNNSNNTIYYLLIPSALLVVSGLGFFIIRGIKK